MKKALISINLLFTVAQVWAIDTYNAANGQLTIPIVQVGSVTYNNVEVTVGEVIKINGGIPEGAKDSYNTITNILNIQAVLVGNTTYTNVTVSVGNVVSVGLPVFATSYQNAKGLYASPIAFPPSLIDSLNGPPTAYAVGDFFQTGNIDLFTAFQNYHPSSGNYVGISQADAISNPQYWSDFTFWRKQNDGSYKQLTTMKGCLHPRKALVADFNQDSFPDVYISCTGYDSGTYPGEQSKLLLSDGKGSFNLRSVDDVGYHHSSAAADINGDGFPDIVSSEFSKPIYFLINNKDGTFKRDDTRIIGSISNSYTAKELIDIDADGFVDLIAGYGFESQYKDSTKIFFGDKNGYFGNRYKVIPPVPGRGSVLDFIFIKDKIQNGLYVNRTADGSSSTCFYCTTTIQWVNLNTMDSSIVVDKISKQIGPYYLYGPSWTPWWIPSNQNGVNGVVPFWTITNTFVTQ